MERGADAAKGWGGGGAKGHKHVANSNKHAQSIQELTPAPPPSAHHRGAKTTEGEGEVGRGGGAPHHITACACASDE